MDPLLRDPTNFQLSFIPCIGYEDLRVSDLFISRCLEWNVELIHNLFNVRDIRKILSIPHYLLAEDMTVLCDIIEKMAPTQ